MGCGTDEGVILRELRLGKNKKKKGTPLHARLTVVSNLDSGRRSQLASVLAGEVVAGLRDRGSEHGAHVDIVWRAADLPSIAGPLSAGQGMQEPQPAEDPPPEASPAQLAERERALREELDSSRRALDQDAREHLATAEALVTGAEADLEEALADLAAVEEAERASADRRSEWAERHAEIEVRHAEAARELAEAERLNSDAVAHALAAYRRLQSVKPRPSQRAAMLAERWAAYRARQAGEAVEVEPPPEYLVAPAQAALDAARAAVEEAERAGEVHVDIDTAAVESLERAHRRVLEAERRTDQRPSRLNRRRLEGAEQAEREALIRLGAADYDDYLRRIVPVVRAGGVTRNLEAAREALADAEAVWEELHGGVAPMSDEGLAETLAAIREEAVEVLGHDPGDDALEASLQGHVENVVDVAWARDELIEALAGVGVDAIDDIEAVAEDWLSGGPQRRARVRELEAALADIAAELADASARITRPAAEDDTAPGQPRGQEEPAEQNVAVDRARSEVETREVRLAQARAAQSEATERMARAEAAERRVAEVSSQLAEAIAAREAADRDAAQATALADPSEAQSPVEQTLYTLARLAAHRSLPEPGGIPVVVDDAFSGFTSEARLACLDLLSRASGAIQVVYLTESDEVASWARNQPRDLCRVHRG